LKLFCKKLGNNVQNREKPVCTNQATLWKLYKALNLGQASLRALLTDKPRTFWTSRANLKPEGAYIANHDVLKANYSTIQKSFKRPLTKLWSLRANLTNQLGKPLAMMPRELIPRREEQ